MSMLGLVARAGPAPFIFNFFWSMRRGEKVGANPWNATTLEWAARRRRRRTATSRSRPRSSAALRVQPAGRSRGDYTPQSQEA